MSNISPVKEKIYTFASSSHKTKDKCVRKVLECMAAVCNTVCPGEDKELEKKVLEAIRETTKIREPFDKTTWILKETYMSANSWMIRRQILSIMSVDRTYAEVKEIVPSISEFKYYKAKQHTRSMGCGMPPEQVKTGRCKVDDSKLEHFVDYILSSEIVKDLPYGTKNMKLASGEIVEVPNLIRSLAPSSLIDHYLAICETEEYKPLGTSTLYKILNDCAASVRKCLEGLDYFVAEGGRSFQDLVNTVEKLNVDDEKKQDLKSRLNDGKSYLKSEYKIHVQSESTVPDHCRQYALTDGCTHCNHQHEEICEQCQNLEKVLVEVLAISKDSNWENRDAILFEVESAIESIQNWKCHIMRARNQEDSRLDLMKELKEGQVLITLDWAMKFLPRKFREGQTDWYAKRGLNWHISVSVYKEEGEIKSTTHVHIFSNQVPQDAQVTLCVMKDAIADVQQLLGNVEEIHIFSDNAGCYKNNIVMSSLHRDLGQKLKTYNFSEAQDGKGPCDRRAANIKSVIKRYINEGHDVVSAVGMKQAIDSRQNGQYRVKVADVITTIDHEKSKRSLPGVSNLYNFKFEDTGLRVWKAYNIGDGKLLSWESLGSPPKGYELLVVEDWSVLDKASNSTERSSDNTQNDATSLLVPKKSTAWYMNAQRMAVYAHFLQ